MFKKILLHFPECVFDKVTREKNRKSLYIASVYNYKRIPYRGMEVGLLRRNLACERGLHTKEHNKINFFFFSGKKKRVRDDIQI